MYGILLTQNSTPIFKYIVWVLGKVMDGIFRLIDAIGIPNVGLAIILFTILVNVLMIPLTIKQQKFSKLSAKMNPEIQAIQNKYKNRKDQDSQMAMNQEMQTVYAKYGVSPTGSCGYLLIQMPILFALYRVIASMPAYVTKIGDTFRVLAQQIISVDNAEWLQNSGVDSISTTISTYGSSISKGQIENGVIDVLNKLSSTDMATVAEHYDLSNLTYNGQLILSSDSTRGLIDTYNNFLGLNMGDSPWNLITQGLEAGTFLVVIGAVMIPLLSALTQWINVKLMPQQSQSDTKNMDEKTAQMQSSMKMMNNVMPLMSAWFCLTLPSGMGLYWIAGSVVRTIEQVFINKHIDKMDFDKLIEQNQKKSAKKIEKMKANQEKMAAYANMNTRQIRSIQERARVESLKEKENKKDEENASVDSSSTTSKAKPGSIMAKANLVSEYNKRKK